MACDVTVVTSSMKQMSLRGAPNIWTENEENVKHQRYTYI